MPVTQEYDRDPGEEPVMIRLRLEPALVRRIDRWAEQRFPDRLEALRFLVNWSVETVVTRRKVVDRRL
jgi:hypothetical protein